MGWKGSRKLGSCPALTKRKSLYRKLRRATADVLICGMALYYFDSHDGEEFVTDEIGLEFPDLESVKVEVARGLADLARDILPGSVRRELAIVVRDAQSRHVLKTIIVFEMMILAG
jgi:hypothetical protein